MSLADWIGKEIQLSVRLADKDTPLTPVTLLAVEHNGIWIESEELTQLCLQALAMHASKTPQIFLPLSSVAYVLIGSEEKTALSEKALGV